ncbi:MAG TPA: DUF4097 family beta strand repeat-containing protein [Vicinamibacterales bacterium]|nr:DUF4097 family beta strand repeat-containing protein [Vicinamibacterales bacterium]
MIAELLLTLALVPTDQTVNVTKGTKLDVNNFAGDVQVKVWDRDAVRVEATHSDREAIDIKPGDQLLSIRSRSTRGGPPRSLDYTITVPKWMAVSVSGTYADVTMDGVGGDVTVDTTRGDIKVVGGSGFISLKSVQGEINLEKAKGRVEVRAVNEGVRLADISADLSAESTNGSILLDRIDSANVDLYTVNGNISYDGPIKDKGLYRLTTHNGLIAMPVPERANAIVTLRTYNGGIRSTFQLPGDAGERRKRQTLTLGNGSAHVELESFSGTISLRRPGEPRPETERKRRDRDKDNKDNKDNGLAMADVQIEIDRALADLQPEIDRALAEAQPEIDRAIAEAMREIGPQVDVAIDMANEALWSIPGVPFVMPHVASPFPLPRPTPRPR